MGEKLMALSAWHRVRASAMTEREREIVSRRFGRDHQKPCGDPNVLTWAMFECQRRDRCKYLVGVRDFAPVKGRRAALTHRDQGEGSDG